MLLAPAGQCAWHFFSPPPAEVCHYGGEQNQMSKNEIILYQPNELAKHINELNKSSTCAFFAQVQNEGGRIVERQIEHYNLDVIISVG